MVTASLAYSHNTPLSITKTSSIAPERVARHAISRVVTFRDILSKGSNRFLKQQGLLRFSPNKNQDSCIR